MSALPPAKPMSVDPAEDRLEPSPLNGPNLVTLVRIGLAVATIALIAVGQPWAALATFLVAAISDAIDGAWARAAGVVTRLGRIIDPFADKFLIAGVFIQLTAIPGLQFPAWAVIVVVARELFVTTLRSFVEGGGGDFSANLWGKLKMILQCGVAIAGIVLLAMWVPIVENRPDWPKQLFDLATYLMVAVTAISGLLYFRDAWPAIAGTVTDEDAPRPAASPRSSGSTTKVTSPGPRSGGTPTGAKSPPSGRSKRSRKSRR